MKNEQLIIEENLTDFIEQSQTNFTKAEIVTALQDSNNAPLDMIQKEVDALLEDHPLVFELTGQAGTYLARQVFFKNAKFCITPSEYEINQGILIPGHRFLPFVDPDIFPSEVKIADIDSKQFLKSQNFEATIDAISEFHILLGTEEMLNYFIAEDQKNSDIISKGDINQQIKITVFDLKKYYKEYTFKPGDSLIMEVQDWSQGVFTMDFLPSEDKDNYDLKPAEWAKLFEESLLNIIEEHGDYISIPDQLARAFYAGDAKLLQSPVISLEEYQANSEFVQLVISNSHCTLAKYDEEDLDFSETEVPEEFMISKGKTDSLDAILEELKIPVKTVELEAFMNDELHKGGESLEAVIDRSLGCEDLDFIDEGQAAVFYNMLEELWETTMQNYNRFNNKNKGFLRERILEVTETRIQWLRYLEAEDLDTTKLPESDFHAIAECSARFNNMLQIMNRDDADFADEDMDQLSEAVEDISEVQQECIDRINKVLLK